VSRKLIIRDLQLKEYRNYHDLNLVFDQDLVLITGPNGVGKTNILEALSLLVPGRGMRSARLLELDNNQQDEKFSINWQVVSNISSKRGEKLIELSRSGLDENNRCEKIIKIDGEVVKSKSNLAYFMSMVWLVPQMDFIFISSASERRKFLDNIVEDFFPSHSANINQFEHLMRERMKILKESGSVGYDKIWVDGIENNMSQLAVAITSARLDTLSQLNSSMSDIPVDFLRAQLGMNGFLEDLLKENSSLNVEEQYRVALASNRAFDSASGRTSCGPHLSDLEVVNLSTGCVASLCSTGEQKSLLISIKFAEVIAKNRWHGILPIMLLDDIVSHLDQKRRVAMLDSLDGLGIQAFITCTHVNEISGSGSKFQSLFLNEVSVC
jgi:DNA replication and repair protein RecF